MKKRNIGLVFILVVLCALGYFFYNNNFLGFGDVKAVKVDASSQKCQNVGNNVEVDDLEATEEKRMVKITNKSNYTFNVTVSGSGSLDGTFQLTSANNAKNPYVLNFEELEEANVTIRIEYPDPNPSANPNHKWECWQDYNFEYHDRNYNKTVPNTNWNLCQSWLKMETLYSNSAKNAVKDFSEEEKSKFASYLAESFDYCTKEEVSDNIHDEDKLISMLKLAEESSISRMNVDKFSTSSEKMDEDTSMYQEIKDVKTLDNKGDLLCKVNSVYLKDVNNNVDELESSNINQYAINDVNGTEKDTAGLPNLYLYKHTEEQPPVVYTDHKGQSYEMCKVSCTEYLKVNFDPPQEVSAGMCFSYAVQVISRTECDANMNNDVPYPQLEETCKPYPHCNNVAGHEYTAGPSEDFDKCINECDGGKYSTACSNKCYQKVYQMNDKVASKVTSMNYATAQLVKPLADKQGVTCPAASASLAEVKNYFANTDTGHFEKGTNALGYPGIVFVPNTSIAPNASAICQWNYIAPFYFISGKSDYLFNDITINGTGKYQAIKSGARAGFLQNSYTNCSNPCVWLGCSDDSAILDPDEALKNYEDDVRKYNEAQASCTADALCRNTKEVKSTFYIGVNEEEDKWSASNSTDNTERPKHDDSSSECIEPKETDEGKKDEIIKGRHTTETELEPGTGGLCYCGNDDYGDWHHYTRWTFPGRWVDKKTNQVIQTPPADDELDFYDGGYNKYCIDKKDKKDLNFDWLKEFLANKEKYGNEKDARVNMTTQNVEKWNISGRTKDFGNYGWSISFKCFYASTAKTCPSGECDDDNNDDDNNNNNNNNNSTPAEEEKVSVASYKTKAADPINPIPAKDGESGDLGNGRNESWNWSDDATKLDIEFDENVGNSTTYEIAPAAFRQTMEELGDNVFTDEYLDYEFELTGDDLKEIVNTDAKEGTKFGDYSSGEVISISGSKKGNSLSAYKSTFLRSGIVAKKMTKHPLTDDALKCNNLDSKNKKGATGCADTSNGLIKSTDYVDCFKKNQEIAKQNPNLSVDELKGRLLECE